MFEQSSHVQKKVRTKEPGVILLVATFVVKNYFLSE